MDPVTYIVSHPTSHVNYVLQAESTTYVPPEFTKTRENKKTRKVFLGPNQSSSPALQRCVRIHEHMLQLTVNVEFEGHIHIYMIKPPFWNQELCQWGLYLAAHLGGLAHHANPCPISYSFLQAVPEKLCRHQPLRCLLAIVRQTMNSVENVLCPSGRNNRSCLTCGDITQERGACFAKRNLLQLKSQCCCHQFLNVWV